MKPSAAAEVVVQGRVQGVGYRAWVAWHASRLGLAGYVMNLDDGRVQVYAEGDQALIQDLIRALEDGPRLARVTRTDVRWMSPRGGFASFVVRDAAPGE
jgi:acylphosphatase